MILPEGAAAVAATTTATAITTTTTTGLELTAPPRICYICTEILRCSGLSCSQLLPNNSNKYRS